MKLTRLLPLAALLVSACGDSTGLPTAQHSRPAYDGTGTIGSGHSTLSVTSNNSHSGAGTGVADSTTARGGNYFGSGN
jgi:hypothetical protein